MDAIVADIVEALVALAPHTIPPAVCDAFNAVILAPDSVPSAAWLAINLLIWHAANTVPVGIGWAILTQIVHTLEVAGKADTRTSVEVGVWSTLDSWNWNTNITVEVISGIADTGITIPISLVGACLNSLAVVTDLD